MTEPTERLDALLASMMHHKRAIDKAVVACVALREALRELPPEWVSLVVESVFDGLTPAPAVRKNGRPAHCVDAVLAIMRQEQEPLSIPQVARRLAHDYNSETVRNAMMRMYQKGRIERTHRAHYRLVPPPDAPAALPDSGEPVITAEPEAALSLNGVHEQELQP